MSWQNISNGYNSQCVKYNAYPYHTRRTFCGATWGDASREMNQWTETDLKSRKPKGLWDPKVYQDGVKKANILE